MLERITNCELLEIVTIRPWLAEIARVRDMSVGIWQKGNLSRNVLLITLVLRLLILRENGEGGILRRTPVKLGAMNSLLSWTKSVCVLLSRPRPTMR